jgi:hypothetical protein
MAAAAIAGMICSFNLSILSTKQQINLSNKQLTN